MLSATTARTAGTAGSLHLLTSSRLGEVIHPYHAPSVYPFTRVTLPGDKGVKKIRVEEPGDDKRTIQLPATDDQDKKRITEPKPRVVSKLWTDAKKQDDVTLDDLKEVIRNYAGGKLAWLLDHINLDRDFSTHEERMALAIGLSRLNVEFDGGGPFGSAIFDLDTGKLLGIGVNIVVPSHDSTAHGEMTAFRVTELLYQTFNLADVGNNIALYTNAEPCGMCRTATLWAGIKHLFLAAETPDVEAIGFDEGVKVANWQQQLEGRGITVTRLMREEAVKVLQAYAAKGGAIYNGGDN